MRFNIHTQDTVMRKFLPSTLLITAVLFTASLYAQTSIVDLNHPYVTGYAAFQGASGGSGNRDIDSDGNADDGARYRYYTSAPTANSYATTDGNTNAGYTMSGSTMVANLDNAGTFPAFINEHAFTTGSIRWRVIGTSNTSNNMATASWMTFNQDSWDNLSVGSVVFDNTSSMSVTLSNNGIQTLRFMVVADGTYYLSDTTSTANTGGTFNLTGLDTENWWTYSNGGNTDGTILFNQGSESSVVGSALNNITAVGLYADKVGFDASGITATSEYDLNVQGFVATAVPEPSTYALLGGLMALGLVLVRRRIR